MSAISAIFQFNQQPLPQEDCTKLLEAMEDIPVDDIGVWQQHPIFLSSHTQWITPESVNDDQPRYDSERKLAITADAIIDNRSELFQLLQVAPDRQRDISDSELILLAYAKWGTESPERLIGDFAFLIWDENNGRLFGARDFSGARNLYYHRNDQRIVFSTLIKPLLSLNQVQKKLNEDWLAQYLAIFHMYDAVDSASTIYQNILQVPPSHSVTITRDKMILMPYSTILPREQLKLKSDEEYVEAFQDVLQKAVHSRLRTHRQVGSQLSGGLDSGSIVSFASPALKQANKRLYTFSAIPVDGFVDWTPGNRMANEKPYIQATVDHVGNIEPAYLSFPGRNALSEIDEWLAVMEMPYKFFENSMWVRGIYEAAASQDIGVLLYGARGNFTISWGSAFEYYASLLKRLHWIHLYQELAQFSRNVRQRRRLVLSLIGKRAFPQMAAILTHTTPKTFPAMINPAFAERTEVYEKLKDYEADSPFVNKLNLPEARLHHLEHPYHWNATSTSHAKLSLKYKLWGRDPSNDLRVIRFCLSVPENQFVQNGLDRALIRRATKGYLPDKVRLNQRVRGSQGVDWLHRMASSWKPMIDELHQLCADPLMGEYTNLSMIKSGLAKAESAVTPEMALDTDIRILMRSLIVYRFLKQFREGR
ncbi:asparagine synthase-related protein [Gorillibacterium massiliense]|uniref:asparagine synthase-related protein n=1 Tax=Gorillibacterium massiliense TaxID=1280390 RepID=UPI0004B53B25|nr:asparagine synthase-related protein [Gorillibacterium massiliense]